jgi:DNA topoisomerase-3
MQINMDKYKTSELGQALKKVYRGTISVGDSVKLAEAEIAEVFSKKTDVTPESDRDTGFFGDVVGVCPLCGKELKRQRTFYGCSGYKEGCKFSVNLSICKRVISLSLLQKLLTDGKTDVLDGFVSPKTGKSFEAILKLENGRTVFEFPPKTVSVGGSEMSSRPIAPVFGEAIPLPDEPPPGY